MKEKKANFLKLIWKEILAKVFANKKWLISLGILFFLIVIEFTTDLVEIVIGNVLEFTNPYRPRSGTIWELHKQDTLANEQLETIIKTLPNEKPQIPEINDLIQLKARLEQEPTLIITAEQFRNLYNQIPPRLSYNIISPFDLLKLAHSQKWLWTKIVKMENSLCFYFLDGDKQLLMDTYPALSVLYHVPETEPSYQVSLDSMRIFTRRIITREQFFTAFDDLPNSVKLRLINNPFELIKWDRNIQKVGISHDVIDNIVKIGFQISQGIYTEVYTFEADDWAVEHLIEKLNEFYPELNLDFPEEKYSEHPDNF